jgi:flagellar protein FliL
MAKDTPADDEEAAEKPVVAPGPGNKKIILIVVVAIALVGVSVGGTMIATGMFSHSPDATDSVAKKKKSKSKKPATAETEADAEAGADAEADAEATAEGDTEGADEEGVGKKEAVYMDFEQPFVVNFMDENQLRYLQVSVAVMSHDAKMAELVKRHMPIIRNNLVMLFSNQTRAQIISREGKEKIRAEAQAEVQKILKEQTGKPVVEALYLTSFVMQ